jgi:hypothetical protein
VEARLRAREALGQDPAQTNLFDSPPMKMSAAYASAADEKLEPCAARGRPRFAATSQNEPETPEPPTGIEPVTCCLQNSCSAN